ncbi:MAG: hypothetical protein WKG07_33980 [Hymenobacter sp.]
MKIIDVYPDDTPDNPRTAPSVHLGGYQQMVRSEVMRGRFRNSFEKPERFVAGQVHGRALRGAGPHATPSARATG